MKGRGPHDAQARDGQSELRHRCRDMSGRIQFFVTDDGVGADAHEAFKRWDMGDIIAAVGRAVQDQPASFRPRPTFRP